MVNERRHVDKAHLACALAIPFDKGFDKATRRVYAHAGFGLGWLYPAQFHGRGRQGNHAVAAVVAIAFVVHKNHAEVGSRCNRFGQIACIHVGMAAWLEYQGGADVVDVVFDPLTARDDGVAWEFGQARCHDAKGFAASVHFYGVNFFTELHGNSLYRWVLKCVR